jgi:hypothetical protein
MKLAMKTTQWLMFAGMVAAFATVVSNAQAEHPVIRRGTSVLHYMTRNSLVATDAASNVVGSLRLEFKEQGHSQKQSLRLLAHGFEADSAYGLIAVVGDDTNAVPVTTLESDSAGRLRFSYMSTGQGHGGRNPVPDALTPLTDLHFIGLENASTQTVAYAWIADADTFNYLLKRNLTPEDTNGTAAGSVSLIANQNRVHFRLLAGGLSATNDYHMALNSNIVSTVTANDRGRLEITSWPSNAPPILDLRSLSLLDGSSNVVLSTTLPR